MLFTHLVPYHVVIGQVSPSMAYLGCFAERCGVEIAEDLEAQLGRQGGEEVDFEEVTDVGRDE